MTSIFKFLSKWQVVTLFVLSLTTFAFGASSIAKESLPSFTRILSYDEVMNLTPTKRADYLRGLRKLFVEIDRASSKKTASFDGREQRKTLAKLIAFFSESIDVAEAATSSLRCASGENLFKSLPNGGGLCRKGPEQKSACSDGYVGVYQDQQSGAFSCVSQRSFDSLNGYAKHTARRSTYMPGLASGFGSMLGVANSALDNFKSSGPSIESLKQFSQPLPMAVPPTQKTVSSVEMVRQQEAERPKLAASHLAQLNKIRKKNGLPPLEKLPPPGPLREAAKTQRVPEFSIATVKPPPVPTVITKAKPSAAAKPEVRKTKVANPGIAKPVSPTVVTPVSKPTFASGEGETLRIRGPGSPKPQPQMVKTGIANAVSQEKSVTEAGNRVVAVPISTAEAEATLDQILGSASKPDNVVAKTSAPAETETVPTLVTCSNETSNKQVCSVTATEEARRKYASDPNPDCIYAGSVVGYNDGQKRSYKCEAPHAFCFGSKNCKNDAGDTMKPDYACAAKSVICNPLLFGVHADGKTPFCVARDRAATAACEAKASEVDQVVQPLDRNDVGIRDAWNDFADRLSRLCNTNETAKTLHCEECKIVRERLFTLNAASRDIKTCGAAMKFEAARAAAPAPVLAPAPAKSNSGSGAVSQTDSRGERKPASGGEKP